MLICPSCGKPLARDERSLRCARGHSFDLAASGYCNLLLAPRSGKQIGDARDMVLARRQFLDRGYYEPLAQAVCDRVRALCAGRTCNVVDAGCGEGYYTRQVAETLSADGSLHTMIGADISKAATQYAAKRDARTQYITASSYHLPIAEHSADVILSLFAPAPAQEFARVLRPDGAVLCVVPGTMHLWELKCAVYDTPYRNREEKHTLPGFRLADRQHVDYSVTLDCPQDIQTLFAMTPYSHRTPESGKQRLAALQELPVSLSFVLLTFEPEQQKEEHA